MGLIRLQLALFVAVFHAGILPQYTVANHDLGPMQAFAAVQIFFMISGFYMNATYSRNYRGRWRQFYMSRYARLFPSYLFVILFSGLTYLLLTIFIPGYPRAGMNAFLQADYFMQFRQLPIWFHLSSLFMIGQDIISISSPWHLLLPNRVGWSIGAELIFYGLVPLIFLLNGRKMAAAIAVALAVKVILFYGLGFRYSYFPFFGELVFFLVGYLSYDVNVSLRDSVPKALRLGFLVLVYVLMYSAQASAFEDNHVRSLMLSLAFFAMMSTYRLDLESRAGRFLGNASYLVYLLHLPALALAADVFAYTPSVAMLAIFLTVVVSLLVEHFIQRPIDSWRRRKLWSVNEDRNLKS